MNTFIDIFRSLANHAAAGRRVAFCTIVGSYGSTPQAAGASMLLHEDMRTEGTLGGGCVEAEVRRRAFESLEHGRCELLSFKLDHDYGWDDGLICGGTLRIAVEIIASPDAAARFADAADCLASGHSAMVPLSVHNNGQLETYHLHVEPPARLFIAGAGHVGAELARMAVGLDFDTWIIDERAELMTPARLPPPVRPLVGDIPSTLAAQTIDANSYVVIVTRGHRHDEQALRAVIDRPARYIGMIGSRRKVKLIFDDLTALGVEPARLERVHAPIGLPIGSVTVPEIAVSILAQLVQVRRVEKPTRVEGPFPAAGASNPVSARPA